MAECTRGVEIRRLWPEKEMVCTFGGQMFPGTPDGMFEAWDGTLTCVQVVRVPLTHEMSPEDLQATLAQTVVTKVVKSQHWLRATHVTPVDFVVFCWLPFAIPEAVADSAEALMQRIRMQDPRFSLRLRVPAKAGALFPALFAYPGHSHRIDAHGKSYSESDVSTFSGEEERDEDEECSWDITWMWDCEWQGLSEEVVEAVEKSEAVEEDDGSVEGQVSKAQFHMVGHTRMGQRTSSQAEEEEARYIWDDGG